MKVRLLTIIICLNISFLMGQKSIIEVCEGCEFNSIKSALAQTNPYDTLLIKKGTYKEYDLFIEKPMTILGEENPVIDGMDKGEVIRIESDSVSVEGISIINVGTSYTTDFAAIRVVKSKHFSIRNVKLEKLFFGIYLEKAEHGDDRAW